ncbi:MAG TPA: VanZ family protein [Pseudoxanthomonas sp.]|nr:VanZ family protein [Pseudoxanthomonas sp.]
MAPLKAGSALKPLRWPRAWLGAWSLAVLALIVVCLIPLDGLPPLPDNSDKVEHLLGYFLMAASAVQLFRSHALWRMAAGLVALGIGIEFAQGMTAYRSADPYDALFNTIGVMLGMATALTPWRDVLLRIEKRLPW